MIKKTIIRTCFLLAALGTALAHADSYVISVEKNDYLPYWQGDGEGYQGFGRDFFDAFAKHSGHTFTFKAFPIKRALNVLLEGEVDAKFPDNPYWAKDAKQGKNISYSDAVIPYTDGVLVMPDKQGMGKAKLTRLGTIRGFTPFAYLDDINAGTIKLYESNELTLAIKMATSGRTDGVYFNPVVAKYIFNQNNLAEDTLVFDADLPHSNGAYHMSSIKHPKLVEELNAFMKDQAEQINTLESKYGLN